MNIVSRTEDSVTTLTLDDRFDAHEVPAFRAAISLLDPPSEVIRLDLAAVRFLDSTALAELLRLRSQLVERGGELQLHPVSDPVRVILELTGLDAVFAVAAPAGPDDGA